MRGRELKQLNYFNYTFEGENGDACIINIKWFGSDCTRPFSDNFIMVFIHCVM